MGSGGSGGWAKAGSRDVRASVPSRGPGGSRPAADVRPGRAPRRPPLDTAALALEFSRIPSRRTAENGRSPDELMWRWVSTSGLHGNCGPGFAPLRPGGQPGGGGSRSSFLGRDSDRGGRRAAGHEAPYGPPYGPGTSCQAPEDASTGGGPRSQGHLLSLPGRAPVRPGPIGRLPALRVRVEAVGTVGWARDAGLSGCSTGKGLADATWP